MNTTNTPSKKSDYMGDISGHKLKTSQFGNISRHYTTTPILGYGEYEQKVPLPSDFKLNDEMRNYATLRGIPSTETELEFDKFKNNKKEHRVHSYNWVATWQTWCDNYKSRKMHLKRTPISEDYELCDAHFNTAKDILNFAKNESQDNIKIKINILFDKFKKWHIAKGTLNTNWLQAWAMWCYKANEFEQDANANQASRAKSQERKDFMFDFNKAELISNKIKSWLKLEHNINWVEFIDKYEQFEFNNIGWSTFKHPVMPKNVTLLFKKDDDTNAQVIALNSKTIKQGANNE